MRDKRRRSIIKTLTWRAIATAVTIMGIYYITSDILVSSSVGLAINLIKGMLYYIHERGWEKIEWGRI